MKICILTPRFPYPQFGGDALRINEIARHLKEQGNELILLSLSDDDAPMLDTAKKLYNEAYFVKRNRLVSVVKSVAYFFMGKPMQCGYYSSRKYMSLLKTIIAKEQPDLFISHLLRMAPYIEELGLQDKSIIEMTDALSKTYALSAKAKGVGLLKYVYTLEQRLIAKYEQKIIRQFPKVVLVSEADIEYLKSKAKGDISSLAFHSNGVGHLDTLKTSYDVNKICFLGNMRSLQNQDAVLYFITEIFPLIKKKKPAAKFHIVGSLPPSNIQELASDDIIVTGFVDDLEAYLSDSCCMVAPVRVAAGIQNKVLVAMGCGLPVVLSSLISQGISSIKDGKNCYVCDSTEEYANRCIQLMTNPKERSRIGLNGYEMVKKDFCWSERLKGYEII